MCQLCPVAIFDVIGIEATADELELKMAAFSDKESWKGI